MARGKRLSPRATRAVALIGQNGGGAHVAEALECRWLLATIFTADFNGIGSGTGAATDLVTSGGSGTLYADTAANMAASIVAHSRLADGAGGFLRIADTGSAASKAAGVKFNFDTARNSPDSWHVDGGATHFDTINGGFDFFYRSSVASSAWDGSGSALRAFDINGGGNGLRLVLNAPTANRLQLELRGYNAAGVSVQALTAFGNVNVQADTTYHVAGTLSTDTAGVVTIRLFLANGNTAIDPTSNTHLVAQASSSGTFDPAASNNIRKAFNTAANGLILGKTNNIDAISSNHDFDSFRIYDGTPVLFSALTRPSVTPVLQADFNGGGTGTGDGQLLSLGGTGSLISGGNVVASQTAGSPLIGADSGGYLNLADAGAGTATVSGVNIVPRSVANSPDGWYGDGGTATYDTINGAFDFYFRSSVASSAWDGSGTAFRPFDLNGGNGGLRLTLNAPTANTMQLQLRGYNTAGVSVQNLVASGAVDLQANTLYHVAGTLATDNTGRVTLRLYVAPTNVDIDTVGSAYLVGHATTPSAFDTAGTNAIDHGFNSGGGFVFGKTSNIDSVTQAQAFDRLRLFNGVPATFAAAVFHPGLPTPVRPGDNPVLPAAFDPFTPPVSAAAPSANTPGIAHTTASGAPNDTLALTGHLLSSHTGNDLGKDTSFVVYGQSHDTSSLTTATVPVLEADKAALTLDPSLPAGSTYVIWAGNSQGYGNPVFVNKTEAWWVGPDIATRGQTISLFGQNLSYHGGTKQAWIYIKPVGVGAGQWATVTAVNPYKVDFVVPASLANGTYEVWAHNGSAGQYGWSKPIALTVGNGVTWTATTFNVKTQFGAQGNGVANDTAAIQNAINAAAASSYSTVYIPAGTYLINSRLTMHSNVRIVGDGANLTLLKGGTGNFGGGANGDGLFKLGTTGTPLANVAFENLGMDVSQNIVNICVAGTANNLRFTNVNFRNINLVSGPTDAAVPGGLTTFLSGSHIYIQGCNNYGGALYIIAPARQVFIDRTNFYGANDRPLFQNNAGMNEFAATNNTAQDYDNSIRAGWGKGVWWKFLNLGMTAQRGFYFENNVSRALGVNQYMTDQNWGEQYSWEEEYSYFTAGPVQNTEVQASVVSATASSVTFNATVPVPSGGNKYMAAIINGKGIGQWRLITGYSGGTITLETPWAVVPDSTSTITVLAGTDRIAIYNNRIDGKQRDVTVAGDTNSSGIEAYGGVFGLVGDGNVITNMRQGIRAVGLGERGPGGSPNPKWYFMPEYFHLYANNTMVNNRNAIWHGDGLEYSAAVPAVYLTGIVYRNTNIISPYRAGYAVYSPNAPSTSRWTNVNIFDQGSMSNAPRAIDLTLGSPLQLGNTLFINSRFDRGSAALAGSVGVAFEGASQWLNLQNNQWLNFQSMYSGPQRGQVLEAPSPVIEVRATAGSHSFSRALAISNNGTAALSWTAIDDAGWLSLGATSGTIASGTTSFTGLTLNTAGLSVGSYLGTITITSGSQISKATVRLILSAPPAPLLAMSQVNDGSNQRSMVDSTTLTFDQPVTLAPGAVKVFARGGTTPLAGLMTNPSGDGRTYVFRFTGDDLVGGSLADGVYDLIVDGAGVVDRFGQALQGNQAFSFYRLFGDINGDGTVDIADNRQMVAALSGGYVSFLDYNNSGRIDIADNRQFVLRMGRRMTLG